MVTITARENRFPAMNDSGGVVVSVPEELEGMATRLAVTLSVKMRGTRDYNKLMVDVDDVLRAAECLRQTEVNRASTDLLLEEARVMLFLLRRMNATLAANEIQSERSQQAVREVDRVLVAWVREIQDSSVVLVGNKFCLA